MEMHQRIRLTGMTRHVVVLLFLFGVAPLALVGAILLDANLRQHETGLNALQQRTAQMVACGLSCDLEGFTREVRLLSWAIDPTVQDRAAITQAAVKILDSNPDYDFVTVTDANGREICKLSQYHTFLDSELGNVAGSEDFRQVLNKQAYISEIRVSDYSSFPYLDISVPVLNSRDQITGMLQVGVNVSKLWTRISKFNVGQDNNAYIVDQQGILIASQDMSSVLSQKNLQNISVVQAFLAGKKPDSRYTGMTGEEVIGASAVIEPTGWLIVAEIPTRIAFKDVNNLMVLFGGLMILTVALSAVSGMRFSWQRIVKPLKYLEQQASNITAGEMHDPIVLDNNDETGQLARALNKMLHDLQEYQNDLQAMTEELSGTNQDLLREIADHQRVDEELRTSEAKYRTIFENSGTAMITIADDTTIVMANKKCEDLIGYPIEEIEGIMSWTQFVAGPDDLQRMTEYHVLRRIDPDAAPLAYESLLEDRFGNLKEVMLIVTLLPGSTQSLAALLDVSAAKRAEADLRRAKDQLEEQVEARTLELKIANEELNRLSLTDGLTGIANRRYFDHFLERSLHQAMRSQSPLALIMADIDFFKDYNDTYGHQAGDECLKSVADIIRKTAKRGGDLVARYGGEEFAVVLCGTDEANAVALAEEVRQRVVECAIEHRSSEVSNVVTISLGVVSLVPEGPPLDALISAADRALYQAKREGRNCVRVADKI